MSQVEELNSRPEGINQQKSIKEASKGGGSKNSLRGIKPMQVCSINSPKASTQATRTDRILGGGATEHL